MLVWFKLKFGNDLYCIIELLGFLARSASQQKKGYLKLVDNYITFIDTLPCYDFQTQGYIYIIWFYHLWK